MPRIVLFISNHIFVSGMGTGINGGTMEFKAYWAVKKEVDHEFPVTEGWIAIECST